MHLRRPAPFLLLPALLLAASLGCSGIERGPVLKVEQRNVQILSAEGKMDIHEGADISTGTFYLAYKEKLRRRCEQRKLFQLVEEGKPAGEEYGEWEEAEGTVEGFTPFVVTKLTLNGRDAPVQDLQPTSDNILPVDIYRFASYAEAGKDLNYVFRFAVRGEEKTYKCYTSGAFIAAMKEALACRRRLEDNPLSEWWRFRLAAAYYKYDPKKDAYRQDIERRFREHVGYEKKWYETMGDACAAAGRHTEAAGLFAEIAGQEEGHDASFHYAVKAGRAYEEAKKFREALSLYEPYWSRPLSQDNRALLSNNIGVMHDRLGNKPRAYLYFRYAHLLGPSDATYEKNKTLIEKHYEKLLSTTLDKAYASEIRRRKAVVEASEREIRNLKGQISRYKSQYESCVAEANRATADANRYATQKHGQYSYSSAVNRRNRALRNAQNAQNSYNQAVNRHNYAVNKHQGLVRDYNEFIEHVQSLAKQYERGVQTFRQAESRLEAKDYAGARALARQARSQMEALLKKNASFGLARKVQAMCHFTEGSALFRQEDCAGAARAWKACVAIDPTNGPALSNIAVCLVVQAAAAAEKGDRAAALALAEEAHLHDPSNANARKLSRQLGG